MRNTFPVISEAPPPDPLPLAVVPATVAAVGSENPKKENGMGVAILTKL